MSDAELSAKAARVVGKPFQKGVSGCPGGRPRQDVTALARAHTVDAIKALVDALKRPKEAVPAAVAILNRGWGLPKVTVEADAVSAIGMHLLAARLTETLEQHNGQHAEPNNGANGKIVDILSLPPPLE